MKKAILGAIIAMAVLVTAVSIPSFAAAPWTTNIKEDGATADEAISPVSAGTGSGVFGTVYGYGEWIELEPGLQTIESLTFYIPCNCYVYVDCDGYVYIKDAEVEIAIEIDGQGEDSSTRRYYIPNDWIGNDMTGIHTSRLYYMEQGSHTINFLAGQYITGTTARVNYMSITAAVYQYGQLSEPLEMEVQVDIAPDGSME